MREFVLASTLFALACGPKETPPEKEETKEPEPSETTEVAKVAKPAESCDALPAWRFERIELPPEFAPSLPAGVEKLYFSPGMFKPESPGYWSYVFSLDFTAPGPSDAKSLEDLLEVYYEGLIKAVAKSKKGEPPEDAAWVKVSAKPGGGFTAVIETFDAFTTGNEITVNLDVRLGKGGRCINVAASPSASDAAIWAELAKARDCVPCGGS